jgi:DNA-binding SARP family transcriptional activator
MTSQCRRLFLVTMGGFGVETAARRLDTADFGRRKARALLAALLCAGEPVHRDRLLEWFWPSLAPRRGLACLHTTLHALRRALEPRLAPGGASSYVLLDGETYRLDLGPDGDWDGARILEAADMPADAVDPGAVSALERAEALCCRGSFLPEWPYEPWTEQRRGEIEQAAHTVIARLAEIELARGRPDRAAGRYRRLLADDPEREAWHRGLMRAYAEAGEFGLALRQYAACRSQLRRVQGGLPSPQTASLYASLLRSELDLIGASHHPPLVAG